MIVQTVLRTGWISETHYHTSTRRIPAKQTVLLFSADWVSIILLLTEQHFPYRASGCMVSLSQPMFSTKQPQAFLIQGRSIRSAQGIQTTAGYSMLMACNSAWYTTLQKRTSS